jgi:hypothetical protein
MASSGNTWQKKLMAKGKRFALGQKLGTFKPLSLATSQDVAKPIVKIRDADVPKRVDFKPGKLKGGSGCKLNQATRDLLKLRREAREVFLREV